MYCPQYAHKETLAVSRERLLLAAPGLSASGATRALGALTLRHIQRIRVTNPVSPVYSLPRHLTRDRIR